MYVTYMPQMVIVLKREDCHPRGFDIGSNIRRDDFILGVIVSWSFFTVVCMEALG